MKEQYIEAEMDIIVLDCDDVIQTSTPYNDRVPGNDPGPTLPNDGWV